MLKLIPISKDKEGKTYECKYEYDEEFVEFYKKETGATVVRKGNVGKFIEKLFEENLGNLC
jgi:hypothetical protein